MLRTAFRSWSQSKPQVWQCPVRSDSSKADFTVSQALQVLALGYQRSTFTNSVLCQAHLYSNMRIEVGHARVR